MSKHLQSCLVMSVNGHQIASLILENQWGGREGTKQSRKTPNTCLTILPEVGPCTSWGTHIFLSIRPDGCCWLRQSFVGLSNELKNETTSPLEHSGGRINLPVSFQRQHDHMLHADGPGNDAAVPLNLYQNVGRLWDDHNSL